METATVSERFVKVDLDQQECEAIAALAENAEAIAKLHNWHGQKADQMRIAVNRVRYKMNISASLFTHGEVKADDAKTVQVHGSLPPWLKNSH
jgi:hypothetical protein